MLPDKYFGEKGLLYQWWNSQIVGIPLWLGAAGFTVYWVFCIPPAGYAIGALALVAGIMSVREIKIIGKIAWVGLLVCMLITEFRAINKDRAENQKQQQDFFAAQQTGFSGIAAQAKLDFDATAWSLKTAVNGLTANLQIATGIFQQTRPHAALLPTTFQIVNGPKIGEMFTANTEYVVNFLYMNNGSEQGTMTKRLGRIYVAAPDDEIAQKKIAEKFENEWKNLDFHLAPVVVQSGVPGLWSEPEKISDEDEYNLRSNHATVYLVRRVEYKDKTGTWLADRCDHYQIENNMMDINMFHSCFVLMDGRYRSKQPK